MNEVVIVFPIINKPALTDEMIVEQLMKQMAILVEVGALKGEVDEILKDFTIRKDTGYIDAVVPADAMIWADKLNTAGAGMCPTYEVEEEYRVPDLQVVEDNGFKLFSAATINERLRIAKQNPRLRFRYTILDYKRYWKSNKSKLEKSPELATKLRNMFLVDVMGMFTEVLPMIEEGKQLATLVGTSQVSSSLNKVARELSLAYKRALKSEKNAGQLNKTVYQKLKSTYTEFMQELMKVVFTGIDQSEGQEQVKEESKKYSYSEDGRIKLFS